MRNRVSPSPILYSFRRCPYAMRARMALHSAQVRLEHREVLLKNKPPSMLAASAKGTVPVLVLEDGSVIDESWDVIQWALKQNDPENWLGRNQCYLAPAQQLVEECDGEFKQALDRYKYADRHPLDPEFYRDQGMPFLSKLNDILKNQSHLLDQRCTVADIAVMPFVRQFAHVDLSWFTHCGINHLNTWLQTLLQSDLFAEIMQKHALWEFESTSLQPNE